MRGLLVAVAGISLAGAVAAERWTALTRAVTGVFAGLTTPGLGIAASVAFVLAAVAGTASWRLLPAFPAGVLRSDSARAGRTLMAVSFLNLPLLAWIAEDDHWRGRVISSRRWPRLPPAMALAWADWRRLARRPGLLVVTAGSALIPALSGAAVTGRDRGYVVGAALLLGALSAGAQGTAALKRDLNDRALRRLLGAGDGAALAGRVHGSTLAAQLAVSAAVLGIYLAIAGRRPGT